MAETVTGANILPPDQWSALAARQNGFSSGLADSTQCNTAWHQSSLIAAMIGQFIANADLDALDDGNSEALLANFVTALGRSIRLYVGTDAGSANHIVANVTPDLAAYGALNVFVIRGIAANSTGPVDANFDSKGIRGVRRRDGQPLVNRDLVAGSVLILVDDGTYLRCLAPVASELVTNLLTTPGSQAAFNSQYVRIEAKRFAGTNPMVLETFFKPVWLNTIYDNQAGVSLSGATASTSASSPQPESDAMPKAETIDVRHDRHCALAERAATLRARHLAKAERADRKGNAEARAKAEALAERYASSQGRHNRAASRLAPMVPRARGARRALADGALAKAEAAAQKREPVQEAPGEAKQRVKRERLAKRNAEQAEGRKRREFAAAGVEYDLRLASGQREMHVSNVREISAKRASLADPGSLIKRQSERTEPRVRAIAMFDDLCHRAYAGLLPEPKFERGVDVSHSPAAVPEDRAGALGEMQRLAGFIGNEAQAILLLRVFQRQSFAWMAEQGIGEERSISALFLAGTDAVAQFYGFCGPSRASELREHALRHV